MPSTVQKNILKGSLRERENLKTIISRSLKSTHSANREQKAHYFKDSTNPLTLDICQSRRDKVYL